MSEEKAIERYGEDNIEVISHLLFNIPPIKLGKSFENWFVFSFGFVGLSCLLQTTRIYGTRKKSGAVLYKGKVFPYMW